MALLKVPLCAFTIKNLGMLNTKQVFKHNKVNVKLGHLTAKILTHEQDLYPNQLGTVIFRSPIDSSTRSPLCLVVVVPGVAAD